MTSDAKEDRHSNNEISTTNSPYLLVDEAADRLKITRDTLDRWRAQGVGPVFRYHGGRVVYHVEDVDAWSDDQRQTQVRKFKRIRRRKRNDGGAS